MCVEEKQEEKGETGRQEATGCSVLERRVQDAVRKGGRRIGGRVGVQMRVPLGAPRSRRCAATSQRFGEGAIVRGLQGGQGGLAPTGTGDGAKTRREGTLLDSCVWAPVWKVRMAQ